MFAYFKGILTDKTPQTAIVEVGGIGYELEIPFSTYEQLPSVNEQAVLQVLHYQREDSQKLFGFTTSQEKKLFQLLLSVSKTGPKLALSILSACSVNDFAAAIQNRSAEYLQKIPGIGQKSAQRLILEMQEKIKQLPITAEEQTSPALSAKGADVLEDARKALLSVGFKSKNFEGVMMEVWQNNPEIAANHLVRETLRQLGLRSGK